MSGKTQNNVKRRIISVLLTAAMLAGVLPAGQAWAEGDPEGNGPEVQVGESSGGVAAQVVNNIAYGTCGTSAYWKLDSDGVLAIYGSGAMEDHARPGQAPWNEYVNSIKTIEIKDSGITSIGAYAFSNCVNATRVILSSSDLAKISYGAFWKCANIELIRVNQYVTNIDSGAFIGCGAKLEVDERNTVYAAQDSMIFNKAKTTLIACSNGVGSTITVPSGVTTIGEYAFSGATEVQKIQLGETVRSVGNYAFSGCSKLDYVYIPISVTEIGYDVFNCCGEIEDGIVQYGGNKQDWESVQVRSGSSNDEIFNDASVFKTTYTKPNAVQGLDISATEEGMVLSWKEAKYAHKYEIQRKVSTSTDWRDVGTTFGTTWTDTAVVSGEKYDYRVIGVATDGTHGDEDYATVVSATMPYRTLGSGSYGDNIQWVLKDNGVLAISGTGAMKEFKTIYDTEGTWRTSELAVKVKTVVIEDGITSVGSYAFYGCTQLTSVELPDTVTAIGSNAFNNCTTLAAVKLPDAITSIGDNAFNATALGSVTIPKGVKTIDISTFAYCNALRTVTLHDEVETIGNNAFHQCSALKSIDIPLSVKKIDSFAFELCSKLAVINYAGSARSWAKITAGTTAAIPDETTVTCARVDLYGTVQPDALVRLAAGETILPMEMTDGQFVFMNLDKGAYTLCIEKAGHVPYVKSIQVTEDTDLGAVTLFAVGDVNGNGDTDIGDMASLYTLLSTGTYSGGITDEEYRLAVADVNGDGVVNILDYQRLYALIKAKQNG